MNAVERLVEIKAIEDLVLSYCMTMDDHEWGAFSDLFAEDAVFVVNGVPFEGVKTLVEFIAGGLPDDYICKHLCTAPLVDLDEGGLRATGQVDVLWVAQNYQNTILGRYRDEYVKRDGRWLFNRREESTIPVKEGPIPLSQTNLEAIGSEVGGAA
jgi:SnoaL-like domain